MSDHVTTLRSSFLVFGALMVLTAVTTAVAFVDLGAMNATVAMSIAVLKGLLVALYFMHLRYSSRLVSMFAVAGVLWLIILFTFTLSDYFTRAAETGWGG